MTKPGTCRSKGITYRIECSTCKEKRVSASYYGGSTRTLWVRTVEHLSLLKRKHDTSPLYKHWEEHHEGRQAQDGNREAAE